MDRQSVEIALCQGRLNLLEAFSSLPASVRETPVTRSEYDATQWWSPNDHFSHLMRLEWYFVGLISRFIDGEPVVPTPPVDAEDRRPDEPPMDSVHRVNEEYAIAHRGASFDELLQMSQAAHSELLALLARIPSEAFGRVIPGAPWGDGSVATLLLHNNGDHFGRHWEWITAGIADPI